MRFPADIAQRLPISPRLPTKSADIAGVAESADIGEFADRDSQDCDRDCRPTFPRVPRLLRLPGLPTFAGVPKSPRMWYENAELVDFIEVSIIAQFVYFAKD